MVYQIRLNKIMHKSLFLFIALLFSFSSYVVAQNGHQIQVSVDGYEQDTLIIGYYFGKQTLVKDTLLKNEENGFTLEGDSDLDAGVYLLLLKPENEIVQFLVDDNEQHFSIAFNANDLNNLTFTGSEENNLFNDYLIYLRDKREKRDIVLEKQKEEGISDAEKKNAEEQIVSLDDLVNKKQLEILEQHPGTITALMIKANQLLNIPEFEGTDEEIHQQKYSYFRAHYFDNLELDNPLSVRTPFFNERIEYYLSKLTYQVPDSLTKTIDYLLSEFRPAEDTYKYYLSQFINDYAKSKIVGLDEVYVYLAENYYGKGKAPWVDEENAKKIVDDAVKLKPTLIGSPAPDFKAYDVDGELVGLDDIDADYRVLFFWKPDCGHCTKAIPVVKEFFEGYKDKGVKIITVCTKLGKDYENCWEGIKEHDMGEFINLGDQYQRSKVLKKYNATQTPRFFIVDRENTIVMKGIGAEQLDDVMEEMFKREQAKKSASSSGPQ